MSAEPLSTPQPGVVHTLGPLPPVPPGPIASSLKSHVYAALAEIPDGKQGALVGVATESGVNLVVAHRVDDRWTVAAWVGKTWDKPVEAGAYVKASW